MLHDFIGSIDAVVSDEPVSLFFSGNIYVLSPSVSMCGRERRSQNRELPQGIQNLCDWDPVAVLTGNTCVYNDSVMSERKHMHFLVWRKKKKMRLGSVGLTNTHFHPNKPV